MTLNDNHLENLESRGFSDSDIPHLEDEGLRSLSSNQVNELLGWKIDTPGMYVPHGKQFFQIRLDTPWNNNEGKKCKYLGPKGGKPEAWISKNHGSPKLVTEGFFDALMTTLRTGISCASVPGVWMMDCLEELSDTIEVIIYDADAVTNPHVFWPLIEAGKRFGCKVQTFPEVGGNGKAGGCEYFKEFGTKEFEELIGVSMSPSEFLMSLPQKWKVLPLDKQTACVSKGLEIAIGMGEIVLDRFRDALVSELKIGREVSRKLKEEAAGRLAAKAARKRKEEEIANGTYVESQPKPKTLETPIEHLEAVESHFGERLRMNEYGLQIYLDEEPLERVENFYIDRFAKELKINAHKGLTVDAIVSVSAENKFNSVTQYLDELGEGETVLLERIASDYFNIPGELNGQIFKKFLLQCVARAYEPGCEGSLCPVLFSERQGLLKSTAILTLAGAKFSGNSVGGHRTEADEVAVLNRHWIHELGEFDKFAKNRKDAEMKDFVSRRSDTVRLPYARTPVELKRHSCMIGTTNDRTPLRDPTGGRRYPVLEVTAPIDIDKLKRDRDAIWRSAVRHYKEDRQKDGEWRCWYLTQEEVDRLLGESKKNTFVEPWIEEQFEPAFHDVTQPQTTREILNSLFPNTPSQIDNRGRQMALAKALSIYGWRKDKNKRAYGAVRTRKFHPPLCRCTYCYTSESTNYDPRDQPDQPEQPDQPCNPKVGHPANPGEARVSILRDQPDQPFGSQTFLEEYNPQIHIEGGYVYERSEYLDEVGQVGHQQTKPLPGKGLGVDQPLDPKLVKVGQQVGQDGEDSIKFNTKGDESSTGGNIESTSAAHPLPVGTPVERLFAEEWTNGFSIKSAYKGPWGMYQYDLVNEEGTVWPSIPAEEVRQCHQQEELTFEKVWGIGG